MADDPKKPIEELLNDSARQRREEFGAPRAMPGPMRERLQAEVRRQSGVPEQERRFSIAWWPQIAFATAIAVLLIGGALFWQWSGISPAEEVISRAAPDTYAEHEKDRLIATAPTLEQEDVDALEKPGEAATQTFDFAQTSVDHDFREKSESRGEILNNFQVRQTGNEIRVVDEDGSTYMGEIVERDKRIASAPAAELAREPAAGAPSAARSFRAGGVKSDTTEFYFRARGENRSLNKSVLFEGNLIMPDAAPERRTEKARLRQVGARVVGRATINGKEEIAIEAVSVERE